jgi:NADPH-dependent curcumin reductase CurA
MMDRYQQIVLASRSTRTSVAENFRLASGPIPVPADGEILARARYLSLDPHNERPGLTLGRPVAIPGGVSEGQVAGWMRHSKIATIYLETKMGAPEASQSTERRSQ